MCVLMACASNKQEPNKAAASNDLLELLTGFGESLSKRNFDKAVDYMVPEEKAMMLENGQVPADKQKMLLALPLQRLIRHPGIRVENGHIAGIYAVLPNLKQGDANSMATAPADNGSAEPAPAAEAGPMAGAAPEGTQTDESQGTEQLANNPNDPKLKAAVNKFFSAVNKKNWSSALAMMSDNEKKSLLDEKGRLKESAKQRLGAIDQKNRDALMLQDGKLTGVTLLLPSE